MSRIIVILAVLALISGSIYLFRRLPKEKQKSLLKYILLGLSALVLILLAITGRLHWLVAAVAAIVPLIPRILSWLIRVLPFVKPLKRYFKSYRGTAPASQIETRFLKMTLDHMTGDMTGEILHGALKGQRLNGLSLQQLLSFLEACREQDAESAALMMAFLDRYHPQWRSKDESAPNQDARGKVIMSRAEACNILGVDENASNDEVIAAHRRLMQKLHPDRGGNDYLAMKINQAKEVLIKRK